MTFLRYSPRPIVLPENSAITRKFINKLSHLPGKPLLTDRDYLNFETRTIFNDVYITHDGKNLHAIGPPLANLQEHLLPLSLIINHEGMSVPLKHRHIRHKRLALHTFALPHKLQHKHQLSVTITLATGQQQVITALRHQLPNVTLQFATLQKNNPIEWIVDWLGYYQVMGVERVLLYDNASENVEQLAVTLQDTENLPDVVLIDWPFPYGPARSQYNRFCQSTQNNHVYHCFGQSEWTGHFDIDEYLVIRGNRTLRQVIDSASWHYGLLRFDSYWVPDVENVLSSCVGQQIPTARDFNYRNVKTRGKAHKYIARQKKLRIANTHNATVQLGYRRKVVDTNHAAFLHYKCLTDDWRGSEKRAISENLDSEKHVVDHDVQQLLRIWDELSGRRS